MKKVTAIIMRNGYAIFALTDTLHIIERTVRGLNRDAIEDHYSYVLDN